MEMTNEELLAPRWEVIADYPNSEFTVGEIIDGKWEWGYWENSEKNISDFPHIFKKLEWWEERNIEDLPKYLKYDIGNDEYEFFKVNNYSYERGNLRFYWIDEDEIIDYELLKYCDAEPSTEEEYLKQNTYE